MEQRTKRNSFLVDLVQSYESTIDKSGFVLTEDRVLDLIYYYESERNLDKALEVVDLALRKYKYQVEFYLLKARLLLYTDRVNQAYAIIQKAEALAPFEIDIVLLKVSIYCEMDKHEQALSILENSKRSCDHDQLLKLHLSEAYIFEHMKDFEKLFYSLRETLTLDPNNLEALEKMWVSVELSKLYEESIHFHQSLIDQHPYSYMAWYNLGQAYSCVGEYDQAIQALEYAFLIKEDFEVAYRDCADLCIQVQDYKKALNIYHDIIVKFGIESEVLVNIGECHLRLNNFKKAKKILLKAVKLDPYNDEVFFYLGECFRKEKKWHYAINAYKRAIEIEDRREEYYKNLGNVYALVGNWNLAQENLSKATEVGPEQNECWLAYAEFLMSISRFDLALEVLKEAEECAVGSDLLYCKAVCLYCLDQLDETYDVLAEALKDDFQGHGYMLKLLPSIEYDRKVQSMLNYFK